MNPLLQKPTANEAKVMNTQSRKLPPFADTCNAANLSPHMETSTVHGAADYVYVVCHFQSVLLMLASPPNTPLAQFSPTPIPVHSV